MPSTSILGRFLLVVVVDLASSLVAPSPLVRACALPAAPICSGVRSPPVKMGPMRGLLRRTRELSLLVAGNTATTREEGTRGAPPQTKVNLGAGSQRHLAS